MKEYIYVTKSAQLFAHAWHDQREEEQQKVAANYFTLHYITAWQRRR